MTKYTLWLISVKSPSCSTILPTTDVQLTEAGVSENIKIVANFMYDFMHIKPFGYCNLETGILLINFLELKEEHPLLILFADDRAELLNALKRGKSVRHRNPRSIYPA